MKNPLSIVAWLVIFIHLTSEGRKGELKNFLDMDGVYLSIWYRNVYDCSIIAFLLFFSLGPEFRSELFGPV